VLLGPTVLSAVPASAAPYTVHICDDTSHLGDGLSYVPSGNDLLTMLRCGDGKLSEMFGIDQAGRAERDPVSGSESWTLQAADGTRIHTLKATRFFATGAAGGSNLTWRLGAAGVLFPLDIFNDSGAAPPENKVVTYVADASSITGSLSCPASSCSGSFFGVFLANISAEIEDLFPPTFIQPPEGSLLAPGPQRGLREVSVLAEDRGAGLASSVLVIDGDDRAAIADSNCHEPYVRLAPCQPGSFETFKFQTEDLPDGPHDVQVAVVDATGQRTTSDPFHIMVHNAPTNLEPPTIGGTAALGSVLTTLSGTWEGETDGFAYQWLRCPAADTDASGCIAIPGATGPTYRVAEADAHQRLRVRVTATNRAGTGPALSAPTATVADAQGPTEAATRDTTPPVLSGVSLSRKRSRVGRGTTLRFRSSEAGNLSIAVFRAKNRKPLVKLTRSISAGAGHLAFKRRIGKRRLRLGRYTLRLTATDAAGNRSKPASASFRIVSG
jgi:hypothetical protein